jgi:AP-3 complex subunit delta-1
VKFVALLAFNKIVITHPFLVAQQEDVIMECIDSSDMSIRLRALDLVVGMVSSENLVSIVGRLMRQLRHSSAPIKEEGPVPTSIEPAADSDDESPEVAIKPDSDKSKGPLISDDYKIDVIDRILQMCSTNNYGHLLDFDWYIDILIQLVRNTPIVSQASRSQDRDLEAEDSAKVDASERIGDELRNVAVKVKAVRLQATRAAESILVSTYNDSSIHITPASGALRPIAWIVGEYAPSLNSPEDVLTAILQLTKSSVCSETLIVYLQAISKLFSSMVADESITWTLERKTVVSLLLSRINNALEPLAMHPDLEVQERAVEFLELLKLGAEAASAQEASSDDLQHDAPLLLTQAIPSLFSGLELNSVAAGAQRNVPTPSTLDLDEPINPNLNNLLRTVDTSSFNETDEDEFETYYHGLPAKTLPVMETAINRLGDATAEAPSYQQEGEEGYLDPDIIARRRAERLERNRDDPFYIASADDSSGVSTPLHNILQSSNGKELDIDAIPIMQLDLGKTNLSGRASPLRPPVPKARQLIQVAADETLAGSSSQDYDSEHSSSGFNRSRQSKAKQSLLQVDSSHVGSFSLEGDDEIDLELQKREDEEMAKAMKEVERRRLEMQRKNERIEAAQGVSMEGTVVKKKKKKKTPAEGEGETVMKKKKPKKDLVAEGGIEDSGVGDEVVKPKRKKKKPKPEEDPTSVEGGA